MSPLFKCFLFKHVGEERLVSYGMEYDRYNWTCKRCGKEEYFLNYGAWESERRPSLREVLSRKKDD